MTPLEKVAALLAKTEQRGATEAEAAEAMRLARKIIADNNITADQIVARDRACIDFTESVGRPSARQLTIVDQILLNAIARFTDTKGYLVANSDGTTQPRFFGYRVDVELAAFIYAICSSAIATESDKYAAGIQTNGRQKAVHNFRVGVAVRLRERLNDFHANDPTTGTDLIVLKNQLVTAALEAATAHSTISSQIVEYDPSVVAFHHGYAAGNDVHFDRQVSHPNDQAKLLL